MGTPIEIGRVRTDFVRMIEAPVEAFFTHNG
jgi:hypothetical protein